MTKVAIHQPNYLPWAGYFAKMSLCDIFVVLDTVQFTKNGIIHRNKIRTKEGWTWLTIPIEKKYVGMPIKDVLLPKDGSWWGKHWRLILGNYGKAKYFKDFKDFFEELYHSKSYSKLQKLNEDIIFYIAEAFGVMPKKVIRASELDLDGNLRKTELNLEIVKTLGGDVYISGIGAKKYLDEKKFEEIGIKVLYAQFNPPKYPQRWEGFEPNMSAIDMLFNLGGEKSRELIDMNLTLMEVDDV